MGWTCTGDKREMFLVCLFSDIKDVQNVTDPLSKVKFGLVSNDDMPVSLDEAHIRARLVDLAGEVNATKE